MRKSCLAAVVAILGSQAQAQDGSEVAIKRTPVSAQNFIVSEKPLSADIGLENGYGEILSVRSTDVCRTTFEIRPMKFLRFETTAKPLFSPQPVFERTIEWAKVRNTASSDRGGANYIDIVAPGHSESSLIVRYQLVETRDPALAAMKFLQSACDTMAETGF